MSRRKREPTLSDIEEGVDVVGTMVDHEFATLRTEILELKASLAKLETANDQTDSVRWSPLADALGELREMLERQEQWLTRLDARLSQLTAMSPQEEEDEPDEVH